MQLKPDADIEKVKEQISQISFGTGKISVENKITRHEVAEVRNQIIVLRVCRDFSISYILVYELAKQSISLIYFI